MIKIELEYPDAIRLRRAAYDKVFDPNWDSLEDDEYLFWRFLLLKLDTLIYPPEEYGYSEIENVRR